MTLDKIHQELGKLKLISDKARENYSDFLEDDGKRFNGKLLVRQPKKFLPQKSKIILIPLLLWIMQY